MPFKVELHRSVPKALRKYSKKDQKRIADAIRGLADNQYPYGSVHLDDILYRIRVGRYRIIYAVMDEQLLVIVVKLARRSETTYKDLMTLVARVDRLLTRLGDNDKEA